MSDKTELLFTKEHEWIKVDEDNAYVGITDYAQKELGDIVFVELPEVGTKIVAGDSIGVIESVKTASDIYSPISGTILEVNLELDETPERINEDAYESWVALLVIEEERELKDLLTYDEYIKYCEEEN